MEWKLNFPLAKNPVQIGINDPLLLAGSCFAEHIGKKLQQHKFRVLTNPSGILFNPLSIAGTLERIAAKKSYETEELFAQDELWYSWDHHGDFSSTDRDVLLTDINNSLLAASGFLNQAEWVVITFGSAWVYELKENSRLVANCHKVPQAFFNKRLLSVKEIIGRYELLMLHPDFVGKKFLFTVSPVRYVRDGLVENNRSKAILIRAVQEIVEQHTQAFYFPAYEIVIDELRDYRFFEKDMVHPNAQAIDYVWERFSETLFDNTTQELMGEIRQLAAAYLHRPQHPETQGHKKFLQAQSTKVKQLKNKYPQLDLEKELRHFGEFEI